MILDYTRSDLAFVSDNWVGDMTLFKGGPHPSVISVLWPPGARGWNCNFGLARFSVSVGPVSNAQGVTMP